MSELSIKDHGFLAHAFRLAEKGRYSTHPNPPVGCVLVQDDVIVGEGYHKLAGLGHAEANALSNAGEAALGATAYVTLEPCSFVGRTPSCAQSLLTAGVRRVVVAMLDPDPRNSGNGVKILLDAGIEVVTSMMASSGRALIAGHVKRYEQGLPFTRLKLAMSLDGKTALASGESKWITSPDARRDVQLLRARSSAIITGVQTVIDDDPLLSLRADELDVPHLDEAMQAPRSVYILDTNLRTPPGAKLLQSKGTVLVCVDDSHAANFPVEVLKISAGADGRVELTSLLAELAKREHSEVLFECGATLAGSLINTDVIDEIIVYVAPRFMGSDARSLLNLPEIGRMSDIKALTITDIRQVGPDFRVTASVETTR